MAKRQRKVSSKRSSIEHDSDILRGMARGPWAGYWADREEEKGESFSGIDIYDVAPEAPAWAKKWARQLADAIVDLNGVRPARHAETWTRRGLQVLYLEAKEAGYPHDEEEFGFHLSMQAIGSGIRWTDKVRGGTDLKIKIPNVEFYENASPDLRFISS